MLVAVGETVWVIDDDRATDQALPAGCGGVASMAVSPNGAFLALACLDGKLRVVQSGEQHLAEEPGMSARQRSGVAACQERGMPVQPFSCSSCAHAARLSVSGIRLMRPEFAACKGGSACLKHACAARLV